MTKIVLICLIVMLGVTEIPVPIVIASENDPSIIYTKGIVEVQFVGSSTWVPVTSVPWGVSQGDKIRAGSSSSAIVKLDGYLHLFKLKENTAVEIGPNWEARILNGMLLVFCTAASFFPGLGWAVGVSCGIHSLFIGAISPGYNTVTVLACNKVPISVYTPAEGITISGELKSSPPSCTALEVVITSDFQISNPTARNLPIDLTLELLGLQSFGGVGGIVIPTDKFALIFPYIGLASTILVATAATAICVKRVKHRKEKQ